MPSMNEIYQSYSLEYDELVAHEDYQANLSRWLAENLELRGKNVIELGVGTGRLTKLYIEQVQQAYCFDRSQHMISRCQQNLGAFAAKIHYGIMENDQAFETALKFDYLLEGWSFGHTVIQNIQQKEQCIKKLVTHANSVLNQTGKMIFIETLGSNVDQARSPSETLNAFYQILENDYGFSKSILRTDYQFANVEEAIRITSFFFGPEFGESIKKKNRAIIQEFTGIWQRSKI